MNMKFYLFGPRLVCGSVAVTVGMDYCCGSDLGRPNINHSGNGVASMICPE